MQRLPPFFLSSVQCHGGDGGADLCRDGLLARGVCVMVSCGECSGSSCGHGVGCCGRALLAVSVIVLAVVFGAARWWCGFMS